MELRKKYNKIFSSIANIIREDIKSESYSIFGFIGFFILLDFIFYKKSSDLFILIVYIIWIISVIKMKINARIWGLVGIFLLFLIPIFLSVKLDLIAEKIARWAYSFIFICFSQEIVIWIINSINTLKKIYKHE